MKIEKSYICLNEIRCYAYHGLLPQEQTVGNEYVIDLRLRIDIDRAMQTDEVADTVNYAEVYEAVKVEMDIPSRLLEHVAGRILRRLLERFPAIEEVELRLAKRNPPMGADIGTAAVEVHGSRTY